MGLEIDDQLNMLNKCNYLSTEGCIELYHGRGRNELINRAFKNFWFPRAPVQTVFGERGRLLPDVTIIFHF